ncbi:MAG: zf-TFIIB domain-containing protein [Hyphomicrobiaceae bacterium]
MSVISCPVCGGTMREIRKHGVVVDACTQCHGIWFDRGELEKLSALMSEPEQDRFKSAASRPQRGDDRRHRKRYDDEDDDDRRWPEHDRPQRPRTSRFLDFFD